MTRNLEKVLISDPEFFTCSRLVDLSEQELRARVFNDNEKFCLMGERARIIREMAWIVREEFEASFLKFTEASGYDCSKLVDLVV